eukprot:6712657-Pyramimonas_sp.AAC.1
MHPCRHDQTNTEPHNAGHVSERSVGAGDVETTGSGATVTLPMRSAVVSAERNIQEQRPCVLSLSLSPYVSV